jgi:hypothetical protein
VFVRAEGRAAEWAWKRPDDEYPPAYATPANGARHADLPHRREMSRVLSGVADKAKRKRQIDWFFRELQSDSYK